jgi:hypothetical protein
MGKFMNATKHADNADFTDFRNFPFVARVRRYDCRGEKFFALDRKHEGTKGTINAVIASEGTNNTSLRDVNTHK